MVFEDDVQIENKSKLRKGPEIFVDNIFIHNEKLKTKMLMGIWNLFWQCTVIDAFLIVVLATDKTAGPGNLQFWQCGKYFFNLYFNFINIFVSQEGNNVPT